MPPAPHTTEGVGKPPGPPSSPGPAHAPTPHKEQARPSTLNLGKRSEGTCYLVSLPLATAGL